MHDRNAHNTMYIINYATIKVVLIPTLLYYTELGPFCLQFLKKNKVSNDLSYLDSDDEEDGTEHVSEEGGGVVVVVMF